MIEAGIQDIINIKAGSTDIQAVYAGSVLLWQRTAPIDPNTVFVGNFTAYKGVSKRIFKLGPTASIITFADDGSGFNGGSNVIKKQSDGKFLVGGTFSTYNSLPRRAIIRLDSSGIVDTSFNSGGSGFATSSGASGFTSVVHAIAQQSDGKILLGGIFNSYNGNIRNSLIRLNLDGSFDSTFNSGGTGLTNTGNTWGNDAYSEINLIDIQSDGKIIIGGEFWGYNGVLVKGIARLNSNGSLDASYSNFINTTGQTFGPQALKIQSDGKAIFAGERRTPIEGGFIYRLNTDGTFDSGFSASINFLPADLQLYSDGKILVTAGFGSQYNGTNVGSLVRINSNSTLDTSFSTPTVTGTILALKIESDGKIIVGGGMIFWGGQAVTRLVRLNTNGTLDNTYVVGTGFTGGDVRDLI